MLKISPAPWAYQKQSFWHEIIDYRGTVILETSIETIDDTVMEGNTKLMALSPKMLELLRYIDKAKYKKDIKEKVSEFLKEINTK